MSICEIFPDDPTCAAPEPVAVEPTAEEAPAAEGEGEAVEAMEEGEMKEGDMEMDEKKGAPNDFGGLKKFMYARDLMKVTEHSALTSNLAYTFGAFSVFMYNASQAFRYRTTTDFYKIGKLGADSTNYWELSDQVRLYGGTAIGGILTLTSLLATAGIASGINMMAWLYVGGFMGLAVYATVSVLRIIGYNTAWGKREDTDATIKATALGML